MIVVEAFLALIAWIMYLYLQTFPWSTLLVLVIIALEIWVGDVSIVGLIKWCIRKYRNK